MKRELPWFLLLVLVGCAPSPPPAAPLPVAVSAPPAADGAQPEDAAPEAPAPSESPVPATPWRVTYHDGRGNDLQFDGARAGTTYVYTPVKPEQSSSGTYSGGEPAQGTLTAEQTIALWKQVLELEAATAEHTQERAMGTGAFIIVTPKRALTFLVKRGDLLRAFDEFVAPLEKPSTR